ncbi:ABC transporter permease [Candidatus Margulisiibacteriota bacterium]
MKKYVIKRLTFFIPMIIFVSFLSFVIVAMAPGDPISFFVDPQTASQEDIAQIRVNLGLDKPIPIRYGIWISQIVRGNFGYSLQHKKPVLALIGERLPATLLLTITAFILTFMIGIFLGYVSAIKKDTKLDKSIMIFTFLGFSMPSFWFCLLLLFLFSYIIPIFPISGWMSEFVEHENIFQVIGDVIYHLVLPIIAMVFMSLAGLTRYQRNGVLDVLHQNFVTAATARGIENRAIRYRYLLKNSFLPMITILGLSLPTLFGGAVIIENIFGWPGIGQLSLQAVFSRDYPLIMGVLFISSILTIIGNLLADVFLTVFDPRVRL